MTDKLPTLGERRVRISFNPSNEDYVFSIKQKSAELIDLIDRAANKASWNDEQLFEFLRLKEHAITAAEQAFSWGVKMATV